MNHSKLEEATIEALQKRESEIWAELDDVCEEHTLESIGELIEINLQLEELSNR